MTTTAAIPARPADVTTQWLTSVLGVDITSAAVTPVGTGQTGATYRLSLAYGTPADLPETLVVKLPSQDEAVRERVALGYKSEHAFYTEVAHTLAMPLPHCYYCEIDRNGADFVMLLADLAPAVQGDQLLGCTVEEARLAARALAGLHGPRWCDPAWLTFTGAIMPRPDADFARGLGELAVMAADTTLGKLGDRMLREDRDTLAETAALVGRWLLLEPARFSLLHGDYRLDNLLYDPERTRVTVVDWQTLTVGLPARDLAYFTGTSLVPDLRAEVEAGLVEDYRRELLGHGVTDYAGGECWRDYRLGMPQIPLITTFGFAFSAATERGDDMSLTMLGRGCRAIRELGTLELIRELAD